MLSSGTNGVAKKATKVLLAAVRRRRHALDAAQSVRLGPLTINEVFLLYMKKVRLFIDTEFTDFVDLDLISIAIVADTDPTIEFYAEITDFDRGLCNHFVVANILPLLGKAQGRAMLYENARNELREWLEQFRDANACICYDYIGDFVLLKELLYQPYRGSEFARFPKWLDTDNIWKKLDPNLLSQFWRDHPEYSQHHSLHDARANAAAFCIGEWRQEVLEVAGPKTRAR
jgi:hypothetical protein